MVCIPASIVIGIVYCYAIATMLAVIIAARVLLWLNRDEDDIKY